MILLMPDRSVHNTNCLDEKTKIIQIKTLEISLYNYTYPITFCVQDLYKYFCYFRFAYSQDELFLNNF